MNMVTKVFAEGYFNSIPSASMHNIYVFIIKFEHFTKLDEKEILSGI